MINNKRILAIIPARGGSKGVKNKNIKLINKKPAIYWPYIAAKKTDIPCAVHSAVEYVLEHKGLIC